MKRKIHITESQLEEIAKQIVNKVDEAKIVNNMTVKNFTPGTTLPDAVKYTKNAAMANPGTTTLFNGQGIDGSTDPNAFAQDMQKTAQDVADGIVGESIKKGITKRQIKEARLNKLVKESFKVIKKKNLK